MEIMIKRDSKINQSLRNGGKFHFDGVFNRFALNLLDTFCRHESLSVLLHFTV